VKDKGSISCVRSRGQRKIKAKSCTNGRAPAVCTTAGSEKPRPRCTIRKASAVCAVAGSRGLQSTHPHKPRLPTPQWLRKASLEGVVEQDEDGANS